MKNTLNVLNSKILYRTYLAMLTIVLISAPLSLVRISSAQIRNYRLPPNVKQYLTDKYQNIRNVTSSLQETPNGPQGSLHISGGFLSKNVPAAEGDRKSRSQAIAKAMLEEESVLLGITSMDEIREFGIHTSKGYSGDYTIVYYYRYVNNIKLDNHSIDITVGADEKITSVSAYLVPAPPELYQAAAKETLKENRIREIVEQNLKTAKIDVKNIKIVQVEKVAIPTSPYVIWKVFAGLKVGWGAWEYRINAFTGEVLEKRDAMSQVK